MRKAAIEQSRPALLAFTGSSPIHRIAPEPFFSNRIPLRGESLVQLAPAPGPPDDRSRLLDGDPLGAALPRRAPRSPAPGRTGCRSLCATTLGPLDVAHPVRASEQRPVFALPALALLDPGDRPVGDLVVEAVVDGDELLGVGVDAVDGEVEVAVLGVAVERVDGLVLAEAHLVEEHGDRLVGLGGRRLLTLSPAQDPVLHGLGAAPGDLGEVDHLLHLAVVVDVEEVERAAVLDLLAIAAGVGARRCSRRARARSTALLLGGAVFDVGIFLTITSPPPARRAAKRSIAARRAPRAAAVCWL